MQTFKPITFARDPAQSLPYKVEEWCKPVRVHVTARSTSTFPLNLSAEGRSVFCQWELHAAHDGRGRAGEGVERVRAGGPIRLWTNCESVFLRSGGSLHLNGGGRDWVVEVWAQEEVQEEAITYWLTTYYAVERAVGEWPPNATHFRVLDGAARFGAVAVSAGVAYPISLAGDAAGVFVRGFYEVGTVVP